VNTQHGYDDTEDAQVLGTLSGTFAGAGMTTGLEDVVARGRRFRARNRAVAAGVGTSAAALVAAIGVLAPSGGAGAGGQQADTQHTTVTTQRSGIDIESAGFSVKSTGEHRVDISIATIFDVSALRAALAEAGVPADVQLIDPPRDDRPYQCAMPAGITFVNATDESMKDMKEEGRQVYSVDLEKMPPGAVLVVYDYRYFSKLLTMPSKASEISVMSSDPGPCKLVAQR
jgi:hypothetical protein